MPLFSIITPVFNRQDELRRALGSLVAQTVTDFECLVVDDGSSMPIKPVVDEFDDRFKYVRSPINGGCTAARFVGFEHVNGEIVAQLDSDNVFFPWALERAAGYLRDYPAADGVAGLYVFPDGFHVRVSGGVREVGPDEFSARAGQFDDSVGVVRRCVVDEWLSMRRYSNLDFVLWLRLRLSHPHLLVDEPWGIYDPTGTDRISLRRDPRALDDFETFVKEFRPMIGAAPCGPVDAMLNRIWLGLIRAGRFKGAADVADWMHERGLSCKVAASRELVHRARRRVTPATAVVPQIL